MNEHRVLVEWNEMKGENLQGRHLVHYKFRKDWLGIEAEPPWWHSGE